MERKRPSNYYELLQVSENASLDMIRHAHQLLVGKLKPYLSSDQKEQAERRIAALDRALSILEYPERRAHYDAWLKMQSAQSRRENQTQPDTRLCEADNERDKNAIPHGVVADSKTENYQSRSSSRFAPNHEPKLNRREDTEESEESNRCHASAEAPQVDNKTESRTCPWRRFWARLFDTTLIIMATYLILVSVDSPSGIPTAEDKLNGSILIAPLFWAFIEPIFLKMWGSTPGKAMLGISVEKEGGGELTYGQGFARSIKVWFRGLGMNLPLVSWITMAVAFQNLTNKGKTSWDREGKIRVETADIGVDNWIGYVIASAVLLGIFFGVAA